MICRVSECRRFETELYPFIETNYSWLAEIAARKESIRRLQQGRSGEKALDAFKERFKTTIQSAPAVAAQAS